MSIFKYCIKLTTIIFLLAVATFPQNVFAQYKNHYANQQKKYRNWDANRNLNGHYFSLGSSVLSCGYYGGLAGVGYEYRHHIVGVNLGVGKGLTHNFLNANIGIKLYLAKETVFLRNLYFNFLPLCYFGQEEEHINYEIIKENAIYQIDEYKYPHLYGVGLFFGYAPVWNINKEIAMGLNIDVGIKFNYKEKRLHLHKFPLNTAAKCPVNWDLGVFLKFNHYKKVNRTRDIFKKYGKQNKCSYC